MAEGYTEYTSGDYKYIQVKGVAVLTGYSGPGGDIALPAVIDGMPVRRFGRIFSCNDGVTSVTLPDSVDAIAAGAFSSCSALSEVKLGKRVKRIGESAFFACDSLSFIELPPSVETIGDKAFASSGLEGISLSAGLVSIGESVFQLSKLAAVTVPDTVTSIGKFAFAGSALSHIGLGKDVTVLDENLFSDTPLRSIVIPAQVTEINYAFVNTKLREAYFECTEFWCLRGVEPPRDCTSPKLLADPKKAAKCLSNGYNGKEYGDRWYKI